MSEATAIVLLRHTGRPSTCFVLSPRTPDQEVLWLPHGTPVVVPMRWFMFLKSVPDIQLDIIKEPTP